MREYNIKELDGIENELITDSLRIERMNIQFQGRASSETNKSNKSNKSNKPSRNLIKRKEKVEIGEIQLHWDYIR